MTNKSPTARVRTVVVGLAFVWSFGLSIDAQEPDLQFVQMTDGVMMATDVWLPDGDGPWSVVLERTPYGRENVDMSAFLDEGYAGVVQDMRGTGESEGEFRPYVDERVDGQTTIDWIVDQAWCDDGRIGMVGYSAHGMAQYTVAQGAPAELDCLMPGGSEPDQYRLTFQGGCLREEFMHGWMDSMGLSDLYEELKLHRLKDDWWLPYDHIAEPNTINTPILHYGGWFDISQQGTLDAFSEVQHQGGDAARGNQYLIIGPWTHLGLGENRAGSMEFPENARVDFGALELDWIGHWLLDEPTGVDEWAPVRVYLMGDVSDDDAPGNEWISLSDWPPPAQIIPLHLTAMGGLTRVAAPEGSVVLNIDPENPVPTFGGANLFRLSGPMDQRVFEARPDVLTFTTEPLHQPTTVIGRLTARVWIRPDSSDLDLSVRLTDVYPDGRSILITDGIQRARMRCGDDVECFLEPGVPTEIEVDLWSTALVFNAGHQIRVAIAGTNYNRFEVNPCDGGDLNNGTPTVVYPEILFGPDFPSSILLPYVQDAPRRPGGQVGNRPTREP